MRKILPFLMLFFTCYSFSQVTTSAVFDFGNPNSLNPKVTPSSINGGLTSLVGQTFKSGSVSFSASNSSALFTDIDESTKKKTYSLYVNRNGKFTISVGSDESITSVYFHGYIANLTLTQGQYGDWKSTGNGTEVTFESGSYNKLFFENNKSYSTHINKITVKYTTKSSVLTPTCLIDNNVLSEATATKVSSFDAMTLNFDRTMTVSSTAGIKLSGNYLVNGTHIEQTLSVSNGDGTSSLTLVPQVPITNDADLVITIPAGSFTSQEGFSNKDLSYSITVRENRAVLDVKSVTPRPGKVNSLSDPIRLEFDNDFVVLDDDKLKETSIILTHDGVVTAPCYLDLVDDNVVSLKFKTPRTYSEKGEWKIVIPEGVVHNEFLDNESFDLWNKEIVLTYYIEVEPENPDTPQPGDTELMKHAIELLNNPDYQGIGYPDNSVDGSRAALRALVSQSEAPSDEQLKEAIGKFYNDTSIVMPTAGNYYNIKGINANEELIYLSYINSKLSITKSKADAAAFKLYSLNVDSAVFMGPDGKFIHVLTGNPSYSGLTPTENPSIFNKLKLAKLKVAGVDSIKTFGLFSISGFLLSTLDAKTYVSTAAVNYSTLQPVDVPTEKLYFDNENSSGFFFAETKSPDSVTPKATLSATSLPKNANIVKLTIENVTSVKLQDASKAYFKQGSTNIPASLTEEETNQFVIQLSDLTPGDYVLVLPVGTFDYSGNDKPVVDSELTVSFTISNETVENFQYIYTNIAFMQQIIAMNQKREAIHDYELNDFVIFVNKGIPYSGLVVDTLDKTKEVIIKDFYTGKEYTRAHLVPYPEIEEDYGSNYSGLYVQAAKLVFEDNKKIKPGDIPEAYVSYCLPRGLIGDLNFGRYIGIIDDGISVAASDCIANPYIGDLVMYVNNKMADMYDGINNIEATDDSGKVYDLQGRKVSGVLKSGIYIKNGKKVYIK